MRQIKVALRLCNENEFQIQKQAVYSRRKLGFETGVDTVSFQWTNYRKFSEKSL